MTSCWTSHLLGATALLCAALPSRAAPPAPFEVPASLTPAVGFWTRVYGEWTSAQVVIHDTSRLDVVYRVLDLSEFEPTDEDATAVRMQKAGARTLAVQAARDEVEEALRSLDEDRPATVKGLKGARREAFLAWEAVGVDDAERFGRAAEHVRSQRGIAERYARAVVQSGRFMGVVQTSLHNAGLPDGLIALAMTESLLDVNARSVSGAVGIWQFLKGTGREYLAINDVVDERRDPVIATLAATRYLAASKARLGSWGAAITAYNYGMNGMARAVAQLGTSDIEVILRDYRTGKFGFAARNYYAEFLASLHVLSHAAHYFPGARPQPAWTFDVVTLPRRVRATELRRLGADRADLAELNPALTRAALDGTVLLPRGFTLRVPRGRGTPLLAALSRGDEPADPAARTHTLRKGETLLAVCRRAGLTLGELCAANGLDPAAPVAAGTVLNLPARLATTPLPGAVAGKAVSVALPAPLPLARFQEALAARRPGPPAVLVALAGDDAENNTDARPPFPPPPPPPPPPALHRAPPGGSVLTSAPFAPDDEEDALPAALQPPPPIPLGKRHHVTLAGAQRVVAAGPAYEQVDLPDPADEGVDIVGGNEPLPEVDVCAGADRGEPWQALPVRAPAVGLGGA